MHSHDHDHSQQGHHLHHHANPADMANKAFVVGIILNGGYVIVQVIAGLITHSMALLSDAGHNLGDVAGLLLSLVALRLNKIRPTQTFTYGYKKTTILAALTNAVILLITIGILGYGSVVRLAHPEPVEGGTVAWVAGFGIIINGLSALVFFRSKDHELNARGAYLHLLSDAMVSLGVVVAGIVIVFTHWYWLDAAISIVVLIVILRSTWSLMTDSFKLSMDAVPPNLNIENITGIIKKMKGVQDIHHVHIWAMSTTENALTTHLVLNSDLSFEDKLKVVHDIKHELFHHQVQHATIELESGDVPCKDEDC